MRFGEKIRWPDHHTITRTKFAWFPMRVVKQIHPVDTPKVVWVWLEKYVHVKEYKRLSGPEDYWTVKRRAM